MIIVSLLPATKLGQGNVFTGVCDSVHRGGLPQCMLGYPPGSRHPPPRKQAPPQEQAPSPEQAPPQEQAPPSRAQHAGRYGQCAGGTHPAGMQSCCNCNSGWFHITNDSNYKCFLMVSFLLWYHDYTKQWQAW